MIKTLLPLALSLTIALPSLAESMTVPYSSLICEPTSASNKTTGHFIDGWFGYDTDADSKTWGYSLCGSKFNYDYSYGTQISLTAYTASTDWLVSPAIHLEKGKSYKISWNSYCNKKGYKSTSGNVEMHSALVENISDSELAELQTEDATVTLESAIVAKLKEATALVSFNTPMNTATATAQTFTAEETGDFLFGFTFDCAAAAPATYYFTNFSIIEDSLKPAPVSNLTATNNGEDLIVNLAWTLPTTSDTGTELADGDIKAVNVYRDSELIATLGGDATEYSDESILTAGFYTYTVTTTASEESDATTIDTEYVGPKEAYNLPYSEDFSNSKMVQAFWCVLDANEDGTTWKFTTNGDNAGYFVYANQLTETVEDDWLFSPQLNFANAGQYRITWKGRSYNGHISLALTKGTTADDLDTATSIGNTTLGGSENTDAYATVEKTFDFEVTSAGKYYVGIHNDLNPSDGKDYYTSGFAAELLKETGVNEILENKESNNTIYNLNGVRVNNPEKGLYIINGRLVMIK